MATSCRRKAIIEGEELKSIRQCKKLNPGVFKSMAATRIDGNQFPLTDLVELECISLGKH